MTTMTSTAAAVIGGVDTHADVHVAAACDQLGAVLGTQAFPTTTAGYRQLLGWLRGFGDLTVVGIEGTGSYGVGLTRFLLEAGVELREVLRPNRQVRRRNGKTDVVDAIAAARAVLSGEASGRPKSHDGAVEALRALKIVHRSANKSRTQALNQMRDLITTAPDELRTELRGLRRRQRLAVCAAFRPGDRDDLVAITKLTLRTLARRIADLDEELAVLNARRRRITHALAPQAGCRARHRPGHRDRAAARRRRQPRPARQRTVLGRAAGLQPDRSIIGKDHPTPSQPRWRQTRQQRALAHRRRPHGHRPAHQGLR